MQVERQAGWSSSRQVFPDIDIRATRIPGTATHIQSQHTCLGQVIQATDEGGGARAGAAEEGALVRRRGADWSSGLWAGGLKVMWMGVLLLFSLSDVVGCKAGDEETGEAEKVETA